MFCFEEVSHYNRSWNEWECINSILAKRILLWNAKQYIEYKNADTSTLLINGNEHISQLSKTFSSLVWARKFTLSIRLSFFLSFFLHSIGTHITQTSCQSTLVHFEYVPQSEKLIIIDKLWNEVWKWSTKATTINFFCLTHFFTYWSTHLH